MTPPQPESKRVVKDADERRDEILDVAQSLFVEQGYEKTPIRAIIDQIGIAKGTFYHHFSSKEGLLDALVQRLTDHAVALALPKLHDPELDAVAKFHAIFGGVGGWKLRNKAMFMPLIRALYAPGNTQLRQRVQGKGLDLFAPIVEQVIAQGVAEGVFTCPSPDITVRIMFSLASDMGEVLVAHLLSTPQPPASELKRHLDAYNDGINRLLGAAPGTIELYRWELVAPWFESAG